MLLYSHEGTINPPEQQKEYKYDKRNRKINTNTKDYQSTTQPKRKRKNKKIVRDSELVIEYYKQERTRYITENKDQNIEGLNKFAINELNDMLERVQKEVF